MKHLCLLLLCGLLASHAFAAEDGWQSISEQAETAWQAGDWATARDLYQQLHDLAPGDGRVLRRLGQALAFDGNRSLALQTLADAHALEPYNTDITITYARVLAWESQFALANELVDRVLDQQPGNSEALELKGRIAYYEGDLESAGYFFQLALNIDPDFTDARSGLAAAQAVAPVLPWRLDISAAHSSFRHTSETWSEAEITIAHQLTSNTSFYGRALAAERYSINDQSLTIGVFHILNQHLAVRGEGGVGLGEGFLPRSELAVGASGLIHSGGGWLRSTYGDIELRQRSYRALDTTTITPGLIQYLAYDRLWLTLSLPQVYDGHQWSHGLRGQVEGYVTANLRLHGGYGVGYETEGPELVKSTTWLTGVAWEVSEPWEVRCSAALEEQDRNFTWQRREMRCGITRRF